MPRRRIYSSDLERLRAWRQKQKEKKVLERKNESLTGEFQYSLGEYLERLSNRKDIDVAYSRELGYRPDKGVVNQVELEFRMKGKPSIIRIFDMNKTSLEQLKEQVNGIIKAIKEGREV